MALRRCLAPPFNRLRRVIKPAIAAAIAVAQLELRLGIALIRAVLQRHAV